MSFKKTLAIASALAIALSTSADATHYYKRISGDAYVGNICVGFTTTVSSAYHTAVSQAVSKWNTAFKGTGKTKLGFKYSSSTTSSPVDCTFFITVKVQNYGNTAWKAQSGFPASSGGMPYNQIQMNTYWTDYIDANEKTALIMHEIGHTLGIMHTDAGSGTSIPGTSGTDPSSLFRDLTGSAPLPVFTAKDKIAVEYLY